MLNSSNTMYNEWSDGKVEQIRYYCEFFIDELDELMLMYDFISNIDILLGICICIKCVYIFSHV